MKSNHRWETQSLTCYFGLVATRCKPSGRIKNSETINSFKNQLEKVDFENLRSEEFKKFILPLQRLG